HSLGVPTVALAPPPYGCGKMRNSPFEAERLSLCKLLSAWASGTPGVKAFIEPGELVSAESPALWDSDGLHFSPAGSKQLGRLLASKLTSLSLL
ncbi:unnamed protein product, partial [Polarella glacialis]